MSRLPTWALLTLGALLVALSLMGLLNSVHTGAKIVYAVLLIAGIASLASGYRKRAAAR